MHPVDIEKSLRSMVIIVDTREQSTIKAKKRYEQFGCRYERKGLNFGDYSAYCTLPNGEVYSLENLVSIERKMNLDEIAMCYTRERPRFKREFERARDAGAKVYLLIENGDWEKVYAGKYRSKMTPEAFSASLTAWPVHYNCHVEFCREETTGRRIRDILYREMKERLEDMPDEAT